MFEILSTTLKYIFITVIYIFILAIIRLIFLDIRSMGVLGKFRASGMPYLKLVNMRNDLQFKVEESYILDKESMIIGRKSRNDISIPDPCLSGKHAKIVRQGDAFFMEDLESTNGTYLNGRELGKESRRLKNGDRILLGQLDFLFVRGQDKDSEVVKA